MKAVLASWRRFVLIFHGLFFSVVFTSATRLFTCCLVFSWIVNFVKSFKMAAPFQRRSWVARLSFNDCAAFNLLHLWLRRLKVATAVKRPEIVLRWRLNLKFIFFIRLRVSRINNQYVKELYISFLLVKTGHYRCIFAFILMVICLWLMVVCLWLMVVCLWLIVICLWLMVAVFAIKSGEGLFTRRC